MRYALYEINPGLFMPKAEEWERYTDSPRVSEWVEVDFPPRSPDEVIPEQLAKLAEQESVLRNAFQEKLDEISARRANLLALTNKVSA